VKLGPRVSKRSSNDEPKIIPRFRDKCLSDGVIHIPKKGHHVRLGWRRCVQAIHNWIQTYVIPRGMQRSNVKLEHEVSRNLDRSRHRTCCSHHIKPCYVLKRRVRDPVNSPQSTSRAGLRLFQSGDASVALS
jgi:hypothetical protein